MVGRWFDNHEIEILKKIENIDNLTTLDKGQIINHIIFKYMRLKSIKFNIKSYDQVCKTLLNIIDDPNLGNLHLIDIMCLFIETNLENQFAFQRSEMKYFHLLETEAISAMRNYYSI